MQTDNKVAQFCIVNISLIALYTYIIYKKHWNYGTGVGGGKGEGELNT